MHIPHTVYYTRRAHIAQDTRERGQPAAAIYILYTMVYTGIILLLFYQHAAQTQSVLSFSYLGIRPLWYFFAILVHRSVLLYNVQSYHTHHSSSMPYICGLYIFFKLGALCGCKIPVYTYTAV